MRTVYVGLIGFVIGIFAGFGIFQTISFYTPANYVIASKENVALIVKAHHMCFLEILANHCTQDSVYIPIDSLDDRYVRTCGAWVDSKMQKPETDVQ